MDPRVILDDLAARGVTVRLVEGRLAAGPPAAVTPEIRETIRRHRAGLVGALEAGCLVTCSRCRHFDARPDQRPDGWCRRFQDESWALVLFTCPGYQTKPLLEVGHD